MERKKTEKERSVCPYCEEEIIQASFPYCQACGVTIFYCPQCRKPVSRDSKVCPHCGAKVKG